MEVITDKRLNQEVKMSREYLMLISALLLTVGVLEGIATLVWGLKEARKERKKTKEVDTNAKRPSYVGNISDDYGCFYYFTGMGRKEGKG